MTNNLKRYLLKKINITAIVVTYSQRSEYVKKVLKAAFDEGIAEVVLVDNFSHRESQLYYDELVKIDHRIHLIRNDKNLGSAGGFKAGIAFLLSNLSPEYIWFLDDDNVPQTGSLSTLIYARKILLSENNEKKDVVLYSYRGDTRIYDIKAVTIGYIKSYKDDNFMGFRIQDFFKSLISKNYNQSFVNYPIVRVFHGPYGGAFFSFNVLKNIGLPDESFFVYADDHEFTYRINNLDIDQFLIYNSQLLDIDKSFYDNGIFSVSNSEFKIYYHFRNHVYLNQFHKKSSFKYYFNKYAYIVIILFKAFKFSFYNFKKSVEIIKIIKKAIKDGENKANKSND